MKKLTIIFALCSCFLLAKATYPQTLPIDYSSFFTATAMGTDGLTLEKGVYADATQTASAPLMANQWSRSGKLTSGEGGGVSPGIENSTLAFSTYIDNNTGKAILLDPNIQPSTVTSSSFRSTIYSLTSLSTDYFGTFYLGALVNLSTVTSTTGIDFMTLDGNYAGNSQRGRVFVKAGSTSGFYQMGVGFSGATDVSAWSGDIALGSTNLIVLKFTTAATNGTEIASLYLNPVPGVSETATSGLNNTVSGTAGMKSIKGIVIRQRPGMGGKVAGLRFSNNWEDVVKSSATAAPALTIPVTGTATDITNTGFTATWTPSANATGYDVKVYQGTTLVSTTYASGQGTAAIAISGLTSGSSYTYKVIAKGNGTTTSDSALSDASALFTTTGVNAIDFILTDFGDGTWGTVATAAYASGSYPSSSVNGFNLVKTYLYTGSLTCSAGETHTNRILLGRNTDNAAIEFPTLKTVGQVEIHAATGTTAMSFRLEEWTNNQWQIIGTYTTIKSPDSIYRIPVARSVETRLRIANNTGSGLYVYKIKTLTLQQTIDLNVQSSSPVEGEVCFSNLKKTLTFTFNKNVVAGTGIITLNSTSIPVGDCIVSNNLVTIPVTLTTNATSNKSYKLTIPDGAFAEAANVSNLSKSYTVNFQALHSVAYPANYTGLLDVVYKNVNSTNCRMDIYYPTNVTTAVPVVINMHGGGWNHGFKEEQGGFSTYFNMGYAVANVEYRMTGEALAPAAVEDVRGAMLYLLNHAAELNINKNKIIFQGGSAGGHLALIAGYLTNNPLYDRDCVPYTGDYKIMAVIDKYGPSDLQNFMFYGSLVDWLGPHATDAAYINTLSPLSYVNAQTPPTYLIHGDADPTVPYTQSVTLQAALQAAGVKNKFTTVPGGGHGGFTDAYNAQSENEITVFLTEVNNQVGTSVNPLQSNSSIKLNIAGQQVNVESTEKTNTKVYDGLGTEVLQTTEKDFRITRKGIYIIKIQSALHESVFKVLVN